MRLTGLLLLSASVSSLAGCDPVATVGDIAGGLLAAHTTVKLLPAPTATTKPVARGGSWCDNMERQGWPDGTGIKLEDLGPTAQVPVIAILRFGRQNCGWRVTMPAGVPSV